MNKRQLAAIMFTDLVGFTSMMAKNEQETLHVLEKIRQTLKSLIKAHNGKWLKEIGDGTLSSFTSAVDAVFCAKDFQKAIGNEDFKVRIGIHVGEVTLTEDDIFGDGVNIAARIEPLAPPGGICITDRVYEDLSNKPEIKTALLGERELKNVERPIKIYTLVGDGLPDPPDQHTTNSISTYIKDLLKRRVPQIVALYILSSFFIIQIVKWIMNWFMLSPHWIDFTWILLLSLLPSIILISYYHGKSGMDKWVRTEKIFIPFNFIAAMVILFFLFQGKDLGAITREISVEDEEGITIQRVIPKNEFIKNLALFHFENNTNDSTLDWLGMGIKDLIYSDLDQDIFINKGFHETFYDEILNANINRGDLIPLALKREIARKMRMDFFLAGSYNKNEKGYLIHTGLYNTNNGSKIAEHDFEGENLFDLVDLISVKIKEDLQLPLNYIQSIEDLPLTSILTTHLEAYEYYIKGLEMFIYELNFQECIQFLLKSIDTDPDFGIARFNLANIYNFSGQIKEAEYHYEKSMNKIYMHPERTRFEMKYYYYLHKGDIDMMIKTLDLWVNLIPTDLEALTFLAEEYRNIEAYSKVEIVIKNALEIDDNRGDFYVSLAEVLMKQDKKAEALSYYQLYAEKYPDHSRSFQLLGDYYFEEGELIEAKNNYEKSLILYRENTESIMKLALINEKQGLYDEAEKYFAQAMKYSKTSLDSLEIYESQIDYLQYRGQIRKAIQIKEQMLRTVQNAYPLYAIPIFRLTHLSLYLLINEDETVLEIINQVNGQIMEPYMSYEYEAKLNYNIYQKDIQKSEEILDLFRSNISEHAYPERFLLYWEGELFNLREDYESALNKYREFNVDTDGFLRNKTNIKIALCLIKMDKAMEAINHLNEIIDFYPYHGEAHFLLGKILFKQNKKDEALKHLNISNQAWKNADEGYSPAQETKKLFKELENL